MNPVWWLLAVFPLLVLLYFLKLKRREVPVSSTYLWRRSLEDIRANTPFQKLRKSLLFFLQFLALSFLVLAIWQPRCDRRSGEGRDLIVLIDRSASMSAREAGTTRLELVRELARSLVDRMGPGDRMHVLAFASTTETVQPLTRDRSLLRERIAAVTPSALPAELGQALSVASAIASTLEAVTVHVLGDGCYPDAVDLSPEVERLEIEFLSTGTALANAGITEADVRRSFGAAERTEAFVLVENFSSSVETRTVSLHSGGSLQDARRVTLEARGSRAVVFDVSHLAKIAAEGGPRGIRIELDAGDALLDDDRVYLSLPASRSITALVVGEANLFLENALRHLSGVTVERTSLAEYERLAERRELYGAGGGRWLAVFDRGAPRAAPDVPSLYIGCKPPLPGAAGAPRWVDGPVPIDVDSAHPVNRFLRYTDLEVRASWIFAPASGIRPLVETENGAMVAAIELRREDGLPVRALAVGFDLLASNWPIGHYSFPIFFSNAVDWLAAGQESAASRWPTGQVLAYTLLAEAGEPAPAAFRVRAPSGEERPASLERGGTVACGRAEQVGVYELWSAGERLAEFPVSLLDRRESDLSPAAEIDLGGWRVAPATRVATESTDLWWCLALAAWALLLFEWYIYTRRTYI